MHSLRHFTNRLLIVALVAVVAMGCKKNKNLKEVYNVEEFPVRPAYANKYKEKTPEQYVSVLYANFFQKGISSRRLSEITDAMYSVGDKLLARELIVSNFMNDTNIVLPENTYMRGNLDKFLEETYERFYIRDITQAEREWFKKYILNNPDVTVEHVYASFALSNEYMFY